MNVEGVGAEKVFFPLADGLAAAPPDWQLARGRVAENKIGSISPSAYLPATFANDQRREGHDARSAALSAGGIRLRPVMMTALAMIIGMLPMSLGLGEGGEQNAPLGRAVIGGLLLATVFTLLFVPVMYSLLRRRPPAPEVTDEEAGPEAAAGESQAAVPETHVRPAEV